jgi:hypothetical protein
MVQAPTCEELWNEELGDAIWQDADPSWRHGCYINEVYKRESDGTYWRASYRRSTDGETNELREGTAKIVQVEPVPSVSYRPVVKK